MLKFDNLKSERINYRDKERVIGMEKKVKVRWAGRMSFIALDEQEHSVLMDAGLNAGGDESSFKPTDLLLAALGGCTGIDVVSILRKQRQDIQELWIEIAGTQAEVHPRYFQEIRIEFIVRGKNVKEDLVERAIDLSHNKYCSVAQSLVPKVRIITSYRIEEAE